MLECDHATSNFQISAEAFAALSLNTVTELQLPFSPAAKVSMVLDCALELAKRHYPLLSAQAWCEVLSNSTGSLDGHLSAQMILAPKFLANQVFEDGCFDDASTTDLDDIAALTASQLFAVHLIADRFWAAQDNDLSDLRAFLAESAGRAPECVFKDDPSPEELWNVHEVRSQGDGRAEVLFDYAGEPIAVLGVVLLSDMEFNFESLIFKSDRKLAFPNESKGLYSFLFGLALQPVFDFLDANKQVEVG